MTAYSLRVLLVLGSLVIETRIMSIFKGEVWDCEGNIPYVKKETLRMYSVLQKLDVLIVYFQRA